MTYGFFLNAANDTAKATDTAAENEQDQIYGRTSCGSAETISSVVTVASEKTYARMARSI